MKEAPIFPVVLVAVAIAATVMLGDKTGINAITQGEVVKEVPVVNVPAKLRQENWLGNGGPYDGSCCHAALISLLRWQGQFSLADRWFRNHSGGEVTWTMREQLDSEGVRYAWCESGNEKFLEWAVATRRGACIRYRARPDSQGFHMVNVVHLTDKLVGILDNNDVRKFKWIDRDRFMQNWKTSEGGWAFTPVYSPAAPLPPRYRREML